MFCWQARRCLPDLMDPSGRVARRAALEAHLAACAACRNELEQLSRVADLVADAGRPDPLAPGGCAPPGFDQQLMRRLRARSGPPAGRAGAAARWRPSRQAAAPGPVPILAAALLMVAGLAAVLLIGRLPDSGARVAAGRPAGAEQGSARRSAPLGIVLSRRLAGAPEAKPARPAPPAEIPFTVREDLVGDRRGRIPLTIYVLEPAPDERGVVRASF